MSVLNGKVEATNSRSFNTYEDATRFINWVVANFGKEAFEGIQVRKDGYTVNYFGE